MYTSALKSYIVHDNNTAKLEFFYPKHFKAWNETGEYKKQWLRKGTFKIFEDENLNSMLESEDTLIFEHMVIDNFTIVEIEKQNEAILRNRKSINIIFRSCYLLADMFSLFNNINVNQFCILDSIIDIRKLEIINANITSVSKFEIRRCEIIDCHLIIKELESDNGHISICNCIFTEGRFIFGGNFYNSRVFMLQNKFECCSILMSRLRMIDSKFTIDLDLYDNQRFDFNELISSNSNINIKINDSGISEKSICQLENLNVEGGSFNFRFSDFSKSSMYFSDCIFNSYFNFSVSGCDELFFVKDVVNNNLMKIHNKSGFQSISLNGLINNGTLEADWNINDLKKAITNLEYSEEINSSKQFLLLKQAYNNNGDFDSEDNAYVEYRRCKHYEDFLSAIAGKNKLVYFVKSFIYLLKVVLFDITGEYGMNPFRIGLTMLLTIMGFGTLYTFSPYTYLNGADTTGSLISRLVDAYYFSGITFLTIGYGEIHPLGIAKVLAILEGFIGMFLMSYFVVAVSRKIIR